MKEMKKIVHIIIGAVYKEGYGYQENILPAKHKQLGFDVYILTFMPEYVKETQYINDCGVRVIALEHNHNKFFHFPYFGYFVKRTKGLLNQLESIQPDIIFVHGLQSFDNLCTISYLKQHPNTKMYVDQHGDYYNMPINTIKQRIIQKTVFKSFAKKLEPWTTMFWGTSPWRVHYLRNVYDLPKEKTDLLVMGGDESLINWGGRCDVRFKIREYYSIPQDAFLVISGGKIDRTKNIHLLIKAIENIKQKDVFLLVFGNLDEEMQIECYSEDKRIIKVGWIGSSAVYDLFLASDLAVFPGTHSVLWEQACASGLPCVVKDWNGGFSHVKIGENCFLLPTISVDVLQSVILKIIENKELYGRMLRCAQDKARRQFAYISIARRSIGIRE